MQNAIALLVFATTLAGSVIVGPWQPLPGDTLLVQDYSDAVPGTFPNYLASKCMVNKAYEDWQTKVRF